MRHPARISIFLPTLAGGGAERVMATLANGFAEKGYAVDVLLARREGIYLASLSPNVRVVTFDKSGVLSSLPSLISYLRRERPHAVLSAMSHTNVVALLANRAAGSQARLVISERTSYVASAQNLPQLRERLLRALMRCTYRWADGIVVVAKAMVDEFADGFGIERKRLCAIKNPVVSPHLVDLANEALDAPWLPSNDEPVILGVGRLDPLKDYPTLIRAFALLRRERRARLVILGEGPERAKLQAVSKDLGVERDIVLPGFVNNPFSIMRRASLFVLSSKQEGMPSALIQAMACGIPVVSTDCATGPSEILEGGRWGRLVPVGDHVALADAMMKTLDDEQHPDATKRAADFNEEAAINQYIDILIGSPACDPAPAQLAFS